MTHTTIAPRIPTPVPGNRQFRPAARWHYRLLAWAARGLGGLVALGIVLAGAGFTYQAIATEQDRAGYPPPGQLIDVGGYRLHIQCVGAGSPTVILESALPVGSSVWAWVQPEVVSTTRVCAYDRAGEGWSDLGPEPRDAMLIATELHTLLERAGLQAPFVLVGHSFGGLYARVFVGRYPDQVEGMVLIDASHPDQWTRTPEGTTAQRANEVSAAIAPWLARVGVLRVSGYIQVDPDLPAQQRAELRAFTSGTRLWDSDSAVFRTIGRTMAEVRSSGTLGAIPLVVLTATEHGFTPETEQVHQTLQRELAGLSTHSRQRVVQGATHVSLVNNREQSRTSAEAIQQVVATVRTGAALP